MLGAKTNNQRTAKKTSSKGKLAVMLVSLLALPKMKRLSRKTYNEIISVTEERKAIALLIFIKHKFKSSVILNYSNYKLSKLTGLHKQTVKRRMNTLGDMGLLDFTGNNNDHVLFKSVRSDKSNIRLDKLDFTSVKTIEQGLQALYIAEIQSQKDYVCHQVFKGTQPKEHCSKEEYKEFKKAAKFCKKNGLKEFNDNGISYATLSKKMNTSRCAISKAVEYGVKNRIFEKKRNYKVVLSFNSKFEAEHYMRNNFEGRMRVIDNDVVLIQANTYTLIAG